MPERERRQVVDFRDTNFIFKPNFSGDPSKDRFGSSERKAQIIIPTKEQANYLAQNGFNVRVFTSIDDEGVEHSVYHITIRANYNANTPPTIYMVKNGKKVLMHADNVGEIDSARVTNVKVSCNPYQKNPGGPITLYINYMYVEVESFLDPFADEYRWSDDEGMPFN